MADSSKITVNYFCLGALLVFVGSVLFCALGFTVVLPFEATRHWPRVSCTVINSSYDVAVCSCDEQLSVFDTCASKYPGFASKYPCLKVFVSYVTSSYAVAAITPSASSHTVGSSFLTGRRGSADGRRRRRAAALPPASVQSSTASTTEKSDGGRSVGLVVGVMEPVTERAKPSPVNVSVNPSENTATEPLSTGQAKDNATLLSNADDPATSSSDSSSRRRGDESEIATTSTPLLAVPPSTVVARPHATPLDADNVTAQLYRSWDDSFHPECSLTECGDDVWNVKETRRFQNDWGQLGETFDCYYDPSRRHVAILERTSPDAAIHAVVWPCLLLLAGVALWLGLCLGCWSLRSESGHKDEYSGVVLR